MPPKPPSPDWAVLSHDLRALIRERGPLPMNEVSGAFQAMHGKSFNLYGHKLRLSLDSGKLEGIRCDPAGSLALKLDAKATKGMTTASEPSSPNWSVLSNDLRALIREREPLPMNKVSGAFQAMHGKTFDLCGHKLRPSLDSGKLKGIRCDAAGSLALEVDTKVAKGMTTASAADRVTGSPDWAQVSERLRLLVNVRGPLLLGSVGEIYKSTYGQPLDLHLRGHDLKTSRVKGRLEGIQYNARNGKLEVDDTPIMPAEGSVQPATPSAAAAHQSAPEESKRQRPISMGGTTSTKLPSSDGVGPPLSTQESQSSHLLVDSPNSWKSSLATLCSGGARGSTLLQICREGLVVMQLNGHQLGSQEGEISLIKLKIVRPVTAAVLILDVVTLSKTGAGQKLLQNQLCPLLKDQMTTKVVYDFSNSAIALRRHFDHKRFVIRQVLDLQLAFEVLSGRYGAEIVSVLKGFGQRVASFSDAASRSFAYDETVSTRRPLVKGALDSAAQAIVSLAEVAENAIMRLSAKKEKDLVLEASQLSTEFAMSRMLHDTRRATFRDHCSCWGGGVGRLVTSFEIRQAQDKKAFEESADAKKPCHSEEVRASVNGSDPSIFGTRRNSVELDGVQDDPNSPHELLDLIPGAFLEEQLTPRHTQNLRDLNELVLDEGRRPYALLQGRGRLFLCSDETVLVTKDHIDKVVGRLNAEGKFAGDNRAGFPGQLHRISVMRSREEGRIFGVTVRVGRYFPGSAGYIDDLLFHVKDTPSKPERAASVLILGKPGSGKTTVLRDICRKISQKQTVIVVDTSNEIAGDGDIPHLEAIGQSRRMMVPDRTNQHRVMKEALQNHTPQTIVVDEISNREEARACLDIKARGVRVVASAHGDLQSVLKNPELNTLLGGTTSVTLGDEAAKVTESGKKVQSQRAGSPIFDTVVELERGKVNTWSIVRNVDLAVDAILSGKPYKVEQRTGLPLDSALKLESPHPEDVAFLLKHVNEMEKTSQYY